MKKSIIFKCLIMGITMSISCDFLFTTKYSIFRIENKDVNPIQYFVSETYPDTTVPNTDIIRLIYLGHNEKFAYQTKKKWPEFFTNMPADTLSIFFFSPDTVSKYNWNTIQNNYLILKRKDIGLQDLETNEYVISYP